MTREQYETALAIAENGRPAWEDPSAGIRITYDTDVSATPYRVELCTAPAFISPASLIDLARWILATEGLER